MKHYVVYHNTDKLEYAMSTEPPFTIFTKKNVEKTIDNQIWVIAGETNPRSLIKEYKIICTFIVDSIGREDDTNIAEGNNGIDLDILLNDLSWFPEFKKKMANFSLGLQLIDENYAEKFKKLFNGESDDDDGKKDNEDGATEGKPILRLRLHYSRERQLRNKKIDAVIKEKGKIICEVPNCGFDFFKKYGDIGKNYIEVHHKIPLSKLKGSKEIKLSDLALVCANCHRMLHRKNDSVLTLQELGEKITNI